MINFRKMKQDLSPTIIREGQQLYKDGMVVSAKITSLTKENARLSCAVHGKFNNQYSCDIEIDLEASSLVYSDCDCPYHYDCQHLSAVLFYLEEHFNEALVSFSKESGLETAELEHEEKEELLESIKEAESKEIARKDKKRHKELLQEYVLASEILGQSPFFVSEEDLTQDKADLVVIFNPIPSVETGSQNQVEVRLALRVPYRSKPLHIMNAKEFLDAVRYQEPLFIGNRRFFFGMRSFAPETAQIFKMIMDAGGYAKDIEGKNPASLILDTEVLGTLLAHAYDLVMSSSTPVFGSSFVEQDLTEIPCFCFGSVEEPLCFSKSQARLKFNLDYLKTPAPKLFLRPTIVLGDERAIQIEEATLFECSKPGLLFEKTYFRFQPLIKRRHLRSINALREMTVPEPLFGTLVENALPELTRVAEVSNKKVIEHFVTMPFTGQLSAECHIQYLNGELEASLVFLYNDIRVPAASPQTTVDDILTFVTPQGIVARNLTEEQSMIRDLFQDFTFDPKQGVWAAKNDKRIVEFMTDVIPRYQKKIKFHCPQNLLDQFIYDDTVFKLSLKETDRIDTYVAELKVEGELQGISIDLLWDCLSSKRAFIELARKKAKRGRKPADTNTSTIQKILVLDLEKLAPVLQIFDELGIQKLDDHTDERPLWSLASISKESFEGLPIKFTMSSKLEKIQQQMLGHGTVVSQPIPKTIKADLRSYQHDGIRWLDRLRNMHLNGILADDMGLGKTLQAIVAISQHKEKASSGVSIVICPTSLVYNWVEEFAKFNAKLKVLAVDGNPTQRKKMISEAKKFDVLVTSYSLLQKDIELYQDISFAYVILDEAQNIKNRGTRNAKSVKMIKAAHKLILTGTPIENSLEELWSLFDFLMPGLLSSFERFSERYVRSAAYGDKSNLDLLRRKVYPFILRRMKSDVLSELPPVNHIVYHCHLSDVQKELYRSYADTARQELTQLVKKEGYNKVQIQVLATLTRLKQICCHPAIFAKEKAEGGDSAKYEMLMELLQSLIDGKHKTAVFSQYTRMLSILRDDLEKLGIPFCYLDGASKDRMEIVKKFNEDETIPIFLISLKAGGTGLNLTGADTVVHYDLWWNPAAEDQATDRVHRLGQKSNVSSYKLVTMGTIEEKILELQNRKRGLVKQVVSSDEEAISKLTWDEVLELLKT